MTSSCHCFRNQEDLSLVSLWTGWQCSPVIMNCRELSPLHLPLGLSSSKQKSAQLAVLLPGGSRPRTRSTRLPSQSSLPVSHLVCHISQAFNTECIALSPLTSLCPRLVSPPPPWLTSGPFSCHFSDASAGIWSWQLPPIHQHIPFSVPAVNQAGSSAQPSHLPSSKKQPTVHWTASLRGKELVVSCQKE